MILIYVDTNIYLNFLLNRHNQGNEAFQIFKKTIECEFEILISTKILEELYGNIELDKTRMLITMLKPKLRIIKVKPEDIKKAKTMNLHYQDALHALLANKHNAECVVTRNIRHFKMYSHLIKAKLPEDV